MTKKQKIYRAYIDREEGVTDQDLAKRFKVTRSYIHQAVRGVRAGSSDRMKVCMIDHKKHCLWESRFLDWYQAIDDFKGKPKLAEEFRILILTMKKSGFTPAEIGRLTSRDHATIRHHFSHVKK